MNGARDPLTSDPGPWPHRLALAAALSAVPLVLFGGSVTTIGAGMAVDGWLVAEGHFLLFFPVEQWFRDTATFVEHTHRLFGVLVGLFALASVVACFVRERRVSARVFSLGALVAVCAQGTLGGLRVLEDDSELAFLHGALAQAVFALLCAHALFLSRSWRAAPARGALAPRWRTLAGLAVMTVYAQVVLGAWQRHAARPTPGPNAGVLLLAHVAGALLVLVVLAVLARGLRDRFPGQSRRIVLLLGAQIALGILAWISARPAAIGPLEWGFSIAHVLGGGLLLAQVVALWMWATRSPEGALAPAIVPASGATLGEAL